MTREHENRSNKKFDCYAFTSVQIYAIRHFIRMQFSMPNIVDRGPIQGKFSLQSLRRDSGYGFKRLGSLWDAVPGKLGRVVPDRLEVLALDALIFSPWPDTAKMHRSNAMASRHADEPLCRDADDMSCTHPPGRKQNPTTSIMSTSGSNHQMPSSMQEAGGDTYRGS